MSDIDVEVHTAEIIGTPMVLVVISTASVDFQLLPAFDALPPDLQLEFMEAIPQELRTLATHVQAQLDSNDRP